MGSVDLIAACIDSIRLVGSLRHFILVPGPFLLVPIYFRKCSAARVSAAVAWNLSGFFNFFILHLVMRIFAVQINYF